MSRPKQHDAGRPVIIAILFITLVAIAMTAGGCGKQMARMESNQVKLQAMVMANARQLATVSSQVYAGQNQTNRTLAQIEQKANNINAEVLTVQNTQTQLRKTMVTGNQQISRNIAQLESNQALLKDGVTQVADMAQKTNVSIGAVARDQARLHQMVQSNKEDLADSITAVARNQERTHTGIDQLRQADRSLAGQITGVAQQQSGLEKLARNNNQQLLGHLTTLGNGQTALHDSLDNSTASLADKIALLEQHQFDIQSVIDRVANTTSGTADNLTALATTQSEMRQTQGTHYDALTGQLASVVQNQQGLQTGIGTLDEKAERTTAHLTTLATGQNTIQKTMQANNTSVGEGLASLSTSHQTLRDNVQRLDGKAEALASHISSVATELGTVHNTVKNGNDAVTAQVTTLARGQQGLQAEMSQLSEQTSQVAAGQTTLNQTIESHNDTVGTQLATVATDQRTIRERVDTVMATASQLALNLVTMTNKQSQFEQELRAGITDLGQNTDHLVAGQNTLSQTLQNHNDSLAGQLGDLAARNSQIGLDVMAVSDGQNRLQQAVDSGINDLAQNNAQLAADLDGLAGRQNALRETLNAHDESLAGQMTSLAQTQGRIQDGLDTVAATTTQVALDVITLDDNQDRQAQSVQANHEELVSKLTAAAHGQEEMQGNLDIVTMTASQVALDVMALDDKQTKTARAMQANHQELGPRLTKVEENQQQMQSGLDTLTATTTQVALDVITLDDSQARQAQSVQANHQELVSKLTATAQDQQQMQGSLDTLTATTTQVALDVITLDDSHAKQSRALEARQQELDAQIETVAQGQQHMQSNLDTVTATTSQVALDVITLDDTQARIEQAVQANRQELATRLAEIAQGQQQWLARFNAAEARVETMTAGITALEQRVTKLQGTLQTSLQDLSMLLDTESQQRVQFQDSVRQDMQSVTDSVAQLREIQAGLAEHIQRVQDSTQSQTGDILSALEQLQQKTNTDATDVGTELKSSKASPQEIMLP